MASNALLLTIAILLALGFWLLGELRFLIPYRRVLFHNYGQTLLLWVAILFVNVFAGVFALERKFFLKDTGRKLSHVDHQVLRGQFALPSASDTEELE